MYKNFLKLIFLTPFLMAFQCDDEIESTFIFNNYTVSVTPQSNFLVDNIIWINGSVSSKVYDLETNDSIFLDNWSQGDQFSIMKFIEPTQSSNCIDAINNFELIIDVGDFSFLPSCENAEMTAQSELSIDTLSYTYRIGLKALASGDYVISWNNSTINNENRNEYIINNYPLENFPNQIGFDKCGNVSWRLLNESEREFYFSVE
jgi:hypothetical protein